MADQLPPVPDGTALSDWEDAGRRTDHTGTMVFTSPNRAYALTVDIDGPVDGYLLRLWTLDDGRDDRIGQTVVDDEETALEVAVAMAAAATDLDTLDESPPPATAPLPGEDGHEESTARPESPDDWDDDEEWHEALDDAYEKADISRAKGTLTTKTIDGRDYYYLQWREGEKVKSQYIAPVNPS